MRHKTHHSASRRRGRIGWIKYLPVSALIYGLLRHAQTIKGGSQQDRTGLVQNMAVELYFSPFWLRHVLPLEFS